MTVTRTGPPDDTPGDAPDWSAEFAAICDSHRGRLVRWLTTIFGARDAEDIAQEALTRLYVRPGLLDADADAWPWLSVVARNVGRDMARHNAFSTAVDHAALEQLPAESRVPDEVVARDDARRLVLALTRISARDRALLHLRDVEGVPVGDIAARLGLNDNAARQQLHRARRRLAAAYVDVGGGRLGAVALLELRLRELVRKHGRFLDAFAPVSPGVLAMSVPALAAVVGGIVLFATGGGDGAAQAGAGAAPPAYGVPGPTPPPPLPGAPPEPTPRAIAGAARPSPRPSPSHLAEVREEVGPVRVTAWSKDPFDRSHNQSIRIVVDIPIVGPYTIEIDRYPGEPGPVCSRIGCPTALPTPPGNR